jgi:hypothetical protein
MCKVLSKSDPLFDCSLVNTDFILRNLSLCNVCKLLCVIRLLLVSFCPPLRVYLFHPSDNDLHPFFSITFGSSPHI